MLCANRGVSRPVMLPTIMLPGGDCVFEAAGRVLHLVASFEIRLDLGEEPLAGVGRKPPLEKCSTVV